MSEEERWLQLDERLKRLDFLDRQEETGRLNEAYYNLMGAYQEARMLNRIQCHMTLIIGSFDIFPGIIHITITTKFKFLFSILSRISIIFHLYFYII